MLSLVRACVASQPAVHTASSVSSRPARLFHASGVVRGVLPVPANEPIKGYMPGSPERAELVARVEEMKKTQVEIPLVINGKEVRTGDVHKIRCPHDHQHILGYYHNAKPEHVQEAIQSALDARQQWRRLSVETRMGVFMRAADIAATRMRATLNAATLLGQSKNFYQAEIDSACELIDFLRFNCFFASQIQTMQPQSTPAVWNRSYARPLEGFVYAASPFNFTAIGLNLAAAPATMGNTVVWKPSAHAMLSNWYIMELFQEAGMPPGVINFIPGDPAMITDVCIDHPRLGGVHYTGSSQVFNSILKKVGERAGTYHSYPRVVGETGGKNFILAHPTADIRAVSVAIARGAFEYAGQKCSATSRAYIPKSLFGKLKEHLAHDMQFVKTGDPLDPTVVCNAVIHEASFDKCVSYIEHARTSERCTILHGGSADKSQGYFVQPTVVVTTDPLDKLMTEEIFGPIIAIYVYDDVDWHRTLHLVDRSCKYGLTGSVFARDVYAVEEAFHALDEAAGNLYINDKSTGSIVHQQPFGGARLSGTNDKAGSMLNLLRWTSMLSVKESFLPSHEVLYPYQK